MQGTLKELRGYRNLSQRELGEKSGVSKRSIMAYENDCKKFENARFKTVIKLAAALHVNIADFNLTENE